MMSWVSLFFEGVLASLMVALIVYCVKLNRRLTLLRNQDAEMAEMIAGFRDVSDRAEQSAQRLKAAGLAAERSLRAAILEAEAVRRDLSPIAMPPVPAETGSPPDVASDVAPVVDFAKAERPAEPRPPKRDLLMGEQAGEPAKRAETREEAEQAVLHAIRSARSGAA